MDLVDLARVKDALSIKTDVEDSKLARLITEVSARMEREMLRGIEVKERTEDAQLATGQRVFSVRAAPITSVSSVMVATTRDFSGSDVLTENTDYVVNQLRGTIRMLTMVAPLRDPYSGVNTSPLFVRVTYTGGLSRSTTDLTASFPDISSACALQVSYLWQRKNSLGGSVEMRDSKAEFTGEYTLLADVQKVCDYWKRRTMA